jgi:PAS domain S-box-containing protein
MLPERLPAMRLNLSLFQKALVLIAVPLAFQLVFVFMLGALRQQVEQEEARQVHAREVYRILDLMLRNVMEQSYVAIVASTAKSIHIHEEADSMLHFVGSNAEERQAFKECDDLQLQLGKSWNSTKDLLDSGNRVAALHEFQATQTIAKKLLSVCDRLSAVEHAVEASEVQAQTKGRDRIEQLIKAAVLFNIFLAIALVFYFNKGTTKRLDVLMDNTVRLAANMPLNPPLVGDDEIAQLDRTFSAMAEALAVAARQERAIVDKAMDVICSISAGGKFTRVSPAAETVWGYQPTVLLGSSYLEFIAQPDKEKANAAMKNIKAGLREEPIEAQVVRKDGRLVDTLWSARWSAEDQTIFCVAHDITARKQAENLLKEAESRVRLIVESLPVGLLIIDARGVIEFTNPCVKQMFGLSSGELHNQHVAKLFCAAKTDGTLAAIGASSPAAEVEETVPARLSMPDFGEFKEELFARAMGSTWEIDGIKCGGTTFPAEVSMTEFQATAGQRFLVVILDATQKHAIEQMRQEFIAMVSHDLRSPLTSVQTFLELLSAGICGDLNEKGKKKLESANRNVERLIDLIRDLLDLERFKSGIMIVNASEVSLATLVDRSVDAIKMQAEKLGIEIKSETPDLLIQADADRLVQAIVNILSNSLKFSSAGTTITISGKADSEWAELRITDQGRGIPIEDQVRIFERFQQVKESEADFKRGTGLGLPICKAIIEQHGGTIGVESEPGKGSSFWFRLPVGGVA